MALVAVPPRRIIEARPAIDDLIGALIAPQPVEVVRPADLVHLTFSFVNMQFGTGATPQHPPLLTRRTRSRAAFLVVDCHPQHVTEAALLETAPKFPVTNPPPPLHLGAGSRPPTDPDVGKKGFDLTNPADLAALPVPPLWSNVAGSSRLVFRVTNESLLYSEEGLHRGDGRARSQRRAPCRATHRRRPRPKWGEFYGSDLIDITNVLVAANTPFLRTTRARRHVKLARRADARRRGAHLTRPHAGDPRDTRAGSVSTPPIATRSRVRLSAPSWGSAKLRRPRSACRSPST